MKKLFRVKNAAFLLLPLSASQNLTRFLFMKKRKNSSHFHSNGKPYSRNIILLRSIDHDRDPDQLVGREEKEIALLIGYQLPLTSLHIRLQFLVSFIEFVNLKKQRASKYVRPLMRPLRAVFLRFRCTLLVGTPSNHLISTRSLARPELLRAISISVNMDGLTDPRAYQLGRPGRPGRPWALH